MCLRTCSRSWNWHRKCFNIFSPLPSHQACHHPTLLRLLRVVVKRDACRQFTPKKLQFSFHHAMNTFYHLEAPVLAATQCSAVSCRKRGRLQPKPGVSQARRGQRRARVKPDGHRGGRIGPERLWPTIKNGWRVCTGLEMELCWLQTEWPNSPFKN